MEAVAHNEKFAKKVGVPMSVGKDFSKADKGKTFRKGGTSSPSVQGINKQKTHHGLMQMPNAMLNKYIGHKDGGSMKAVDKNKNPGLAKLPTVVRNKMGYMKKGGMTDAKEDTKMDKSQDKAMIKKAFKQHDAQEHKGGKGTSLKLAKGGTFRSSANGIATKGKTKGEMIKECKNQKFLKTNYAKSLSCSHPDISRFVNGNKSSGHCGYCVPCIIRQAAEKHAGLNKSDYLVNIKKAPPEGRLQKGRDLKAFKMALEKFKLLKPHSFGLEILRSGPLPFASKMELDNYIDLYKRGMSEVAKLLNK